MSFETESITSTTNSEVEQNPKLIEDACKFKDNHSKRQEENGGKRREIFLFMFYSPKYRFWDLMSIQTFVYLKLFNFSFKVFIFISQVSIVFFKLFNKIQTLI